MPSSFLISRYSFRTVIAAILMVSVVFSSPVARGQSDLARTSEDPSSRPEFQYKVIWSSDIGSYTYAPEKWGDLRVSLTNARPESREILCSTYFDQDPSLQFGRRVWLPAHSILRMSHPILIPKCDPNSGRNLNLHSLVLDVSTSKEVMLKNESGQLLHDSALLVTHGGRNTGIIGATSLVSSQSPSEIAELIAAARVEQRLPSKFALLSDPFWPADESVLNSFDQIVVTDHRIADDLAAIEALRAWMHAGGQLWVMLDRVDVTVLKRLMGDDFSGHVVDRVGLTSVRIDKSPVLSDTEILVGETVDYDDPVEMVRLVVSNVEVTHLVDGWPAVMTRSCGDGKLLITTVGPRAWMRPRPENSEKRDDPLMTSRNVLNAPMSDIAKEFFWVRSPELLPLAAMEPQVREYIGYSIPSWGRVVGTLLGFSVSIVLLGVWLQRMGHLEHVSWIGSILAVLVSLGLLMIGRISRHAIPATIASVQFLQGIRGTDEIRSQGALSIYQPEGSSFPIQATKGGRIVPDMTGYEGTTRRMVTTDLGRYHWEGLPQPAGLRSASFTQSESVEDRLEAHATFDSRGITGKYSGQRKVGTDAIIATRSGRMGVTLKSDGTFTGRVEDVFEQDQFLSASLLSDEQDRRRRTLEKLLTNPKRKDYPDRPQLMFWTDPWDHGFQFGDELTVRGMTLIALPLLMERPPNGTEMVIPSPLLNYFNRRNPDGPLPPTMWDSMRKEWQERSTPGSCWLSFMIPRELLPVTPRRARVDIKVTGPVGRIEILGIKQGTVTSLQTFMDPVGSVSIELNDPEAITVDQEGRLALGISAGDPNRPELTHNLSPAKPTDDQTRAPIQIDQNAKVNYWRIESLGLTLWATTTEPIARD